MGIDEKRADFGKIIDQLISGKDLSRTATGMLLPKTLKQADRNA